MDQRVFIAEQNIKYFRKRLATEQDPVIRQTLSRLLAEEEAKLAVLADPPTNDKENKKGEG